MNILFIYSETWEKRIGYLNKAKPIGSQDEIQFGISYISAVLKKHNHDSELFILTKYIKKSEIVKTIRKFNPKLICFTAVYREFENISKIAKFIKNKFPTIFLLAGGPHVSLNPK